MGGGPWPGRTVHRAPAAVQTEGRRGMGAHRQGQKAKRGARGSRCGPHWFLGGSVVAGLWRGNDGGGETWWQQRSSFARGGGAVRAGGGTSLL
jgi:hypothetical protein